MVKISSTYRLSETTRSLIKKLAELDKRPEAQIIELLVEKEAQRLKIKSDTPKQL